jgi:hypothetical protein
LVSVETFDKEIRSSDIGSLLVSAKRLHTLHLLGGKIVLPQGGELPPLTDLCLKFAAYDLTKIGDFSNLRILSLETDFQQFPDSLSAEMFLALGDLSISSRHPSENRTGFSQRFATFIKNLNSLEKLPIPVYHGLEAALKAIANHESLEDLSIHEIPPLIP